MVEKFDLISPGLLVIAPGFIGKLWLQIVTFKKDTLERQGEFTLSTLQRAVLAQARDFRKLMIVNIGIMFDPYKLVGVSLVNLL